MSERPELAERHDLARHPEGGWYRRAWTSPEQVRLVGPDGSVRVRPTATLILFCLPPGECSAWHTVASDEVWIWNGAGAVTLQLGGQGERPLDGELVVLDAAAPQAVVPAGTWQRTRPADTSALVSCLVSPGFDFDDFRLADESPP